ncbi:MAG TPA: hypothetical protein VEW03_04565, partial [Longimicrobiaceae bacterium]|nr:hypothetical protein [Longimicrobiaceae bacterium]
MSPSLLPSSIHRAFLTAAAALVCVAAPAAAQDTVLGRGDPPLSVFLDSAGLVRAAAALPAPAQELPVPPLFWVEFDSTGAVKEVEPIFNELPVDYAGPVAAAIRGHLKPQAPSRQPISTHLRVMTGPAAQVDRPPIRRRMPGVADHQAIARRLSIAYALWRGARRA